MDMLDGNAQTLCRILRKRCDSEGIVRFPAGELERELDMLAADLEDLLGQLFIKGIIVYVTRINKETGETIKIVQLLHEEFTDE